MQKRWKIDFTVRRKFQKFSVHTSCNAYVCIYESVWETLDCENFSQIRVLTEKSIFFVVCCLFRNAVNHSQANEKCGNLDERKTEHRTVSVDKLIHSSINDWMIHQLQIEDQIYSSIYEENLLTYVNTSFIILILILSFVLLTQINCFRFSTNLEQASFYVK